MGKPAARIGDTTAHGGSIVVGHPTVLIGGMPAARSTDMHACPMVTVLVPHATGPVTLGSLGVLIGGMPAARVGDMVACVGPPDTIVMGCFTVLIGDMAPGGGGGGGAGGGGGSPGSGGAGKVSNLGIAIATYNGEPPEKPTTETHWVEFQFTDGAGLPVQGVRFEFTGPDGAKDGGNLPGDGKIRREGVKAGSCTVKLQTVSDAKWSKDEARVGDEMTLSAKVDGYPPGAPAYFQVYERDVKGADKPVGESIGSEVRGSGIEAKWTYTLADTEPPAGEGRPQGYSYPEYWFRAVVGATAAVSNLLFFKDWVEVSVEDADGKPLANEEYQLVLASGAVRTGKLDGGGKARIEDVPPGKFRIKFPGRPDLVIEG